MTGNTHSDGNRWLVKSDSVSEALNSQQAQSCLSVLHPPIPVGLSSAGMGFKSHHKAHI